MRALRLVCRVWIISLVYCWPYWSDPRATFWLNTLPWMGIVSSVLINCEPILSLPSWSANCSLLILSVNSADCPLPTKEHVTLFSSFAEHLIVRPICPRKLLVPQEDKGNWQINNGLRSSCLLATIHKFQCEPSWAHLWSRGQKPPLHPSKMSNRRYSNGKAKALDVDITWSAFKIQCSSRLV